VFSATSFPSLLVGGMSLTLVSPDTAIIAVTDYNSQFYGNTEKAKGGWSLERIDVNNFSDNGNWQASSDASGGTPCRENSIATDNPDTAAPYIIKVEITGNHSVIIIFSEYIDNSVLQNTEYYNISNMGNPIEANPLNIEYSKQVELIFESDFNSGTVYELTVSSEIGDFEDNKVEENAIILGIMQIPDTEDIIINEILFHPYSGASDFVEIYNRSDKIFNLADISIASRNRNNGKLQQIYKITEDQRFIYPDEYFVLTQDSTLEKFYSLENPDNVIIMKNFPTYPNDNGTAVLLANDEHIIDEFTYSEKMHNVFISNNQGVSLERVDCMRKSSEADNWQSAAQMAGFATPTYKNSAYFPYLSKNDYGFSLSTKIFAPGDPHNNMLYIDYKLPAANYVANINIYDFRGIFVKEICRNTTLATEGRFVWDGSAENKSRVSVGPYIIYIEAYNGNGNIYKYKKVCVIAERR
jgi:hypothetical protein